MNDPTGTTTCFGFFGFFASLFPRNWPFAMVILLAVASKMSGMDFTTQANTTQADHRRLWGKGWLYLQGVENTRSGCLAAIHRELKSGAALHGTPRPANWVNKAAMHRLQPRFKRAWPANGSMACARMAHAPVNFAQISLYRAWHRCLGHRLGKPCNWLHGHDSATPAASNRKSSNQ